MSSVLKDMSVLLVEDELEYLDILTDEFTQLGARVSTSTSGKQALAQRHEQQTEHAPPGQKECRVSRGAVGR